MFIRDSAATQLGSLVLRSCSNISAAQRSPLENVAGGSCNGPNPYENWPITATGPTLTTRHGCLIVASFNRRLYGGTNRRLGVQFRSIGRCIGDRRVGRSGLYGLCGQAAGEKDTNDSKHSPKMFHRTYSLRGRGHWKMFLSIA